MRYFFLSVVFVITSFIIVWVAFNTNGINTQQTNSDCNKKNTTISKSHQDYLLQYDWHIQSPCSIRKEVVDYYPEHISTLLSGELNLEPYNKKGKEATITTYTLKEEQQNGDKLSAAIYEIDGKLIGGYGVLENWEPGIFSLDEKIRLIELGNIRGNNP